MYPLPRAPCCPPAEAGTDAPRATLPSSRLSLHRGRFVNHRTSFLHIRLLLAFGMVAAAATLAAQATEPAVPVVLSTDVGNEIDDQWAIVSLLTDPGFDVRGILSAQAPSLPSLSAHASYRLLRQVVERRLGLAVHPPLLEGASVALVNATTPRPSGAASFLVEESKHYTSEHRLNVVVIGAATDAASALLMDPAMADRVRIVAMAFHNLQPDGANEYNEANDPEAWRVLLASHVPIVVGTGDVCKQYLTLSYANAQAMLQGKGAVEDWLWSDYRDWYFRSVMPLRSQDLSRGWTIWDLITLAYLRGEASATPVPRPALDSSGKFVTSTSSAPMESIQSVNTVRLWREFSTNLKSYEATHRVDADVPAF